MRSKITIMNQALAASGQANKELTEGQASPEFTLMEKFYDEIVGAAMEVENIYFGRARVTLTNRDTGDFGFDDKWDLPGDYLNVLEVFVSDYPTQDWERVENSIYINASANVTAEVIQRGAESSWSSLFTLGVIGRLESLLRKGINEELEEAFAVDEAADFTLQKAGTHSSKQTGDRRPYKEGFLMRSRRHGRQGYRKRGFK